MTESTTHSSASFWLDLVDRVLKFVAVIIGGLWTWWNYRKGRTYEQKLELEVVGSVFRKGDLYCDVKVIVKNIGATKHKVEHTGTFCEMSVVRNDLKQISIELFRVFIHNDNIEPGESIMDTHYCRLPGRGDDIVWVKLDLRVVSDGVEWRSSCLVRVEGDSGAASSEVS